MTVTVEGDGSIGLVTDGIGATTLPILPTVPVIGVVGTAASGRWALAMTAALEVAERVVAEPVLVSGSSFALS